MKNIIKFFAVSILLFSLSVVALALPSAVVTTDTAEEIVANEGFNANLSADGTEQSPYVISSAIDFNNFAGLIKSNNAVYGTKYYKLTNNIDFKGYSLIPFGTMNSPFKGTLDGNGFALLNTPIADTEYSGVIGYITQGAVKNLRVSYADTQNLSKFSKLKYFGGIVGYGKVASSKTVDIIGCETEGNISVNTSQAAYFGGIVGYLKCESGNGYINDCVSNMPLNITADGNGYVGGFGGYLYSGSNKDCYVTNCVSFGDVFFETTLNEATVGGFAAYTNKDEPGWSGWAGEDAELAASYSNFQNCVSIGSVSGKAKNEADGGGFIGYADGDGTLSVVGCYNNNDCSVSLQATSVNNTEIGEVKTTEKENLLKKEFYQNLSFDFDNSWYFSSSGLGLRGVAKSHGAGETHSEKDVRLNSNPGLRFRATIEVLKRDYCFEYGFIIAKKDELGTQELTFDYTGRKVSGVAFDSTTDKFVDKDDTTLVISGVVTNIPEEHYDEVLVARTYVKFISGGETVIVYSDPQTSSINLSAQTVRDSESYEYLTDEQKEILESMLPEA
ncbi:MAG: hypothetical protein E7600_06245 [Ruminococcaceae bacterium]|nr:hypothetical protein [Oscillospiraceae bacterium]